MKTYTDLKTLEFLLFEVLSLEEVLELPRFADHDKESVTMLIQAVREFSDKELFPYFKEMDEHPARYEDGEIIVHPQVKKAIQKSGEMGLIAAPFDYEDGGMQLPNTIVNAIAWIQECANNHLPNYSGLTQAAANLISHFGNEHLKTTYFPRMLTGEWTGTMCLTEPQAGSSLSDIMTTATPEGDHYMIQGQKIFISGGDFRGSENVIHLLLARIKGAPPGVKGISLFVVPKSRPVEGDSLESNDVNTIGDFQKMGQKGYCTTHLSFGDKGNCRGWLVGEPHQGLKYMFMMMNEARIAVGRGASAITMAAFRAALEYAKERPQGRLLGDTGKKDPEENQTLIINHPDVKRMLLLQKAVAEGALYLVLLSAKFQDLSANHPEASEREKYQGLLDLLTPITKTFPAEQGIKAVSNGLQVFGGYGYCTDFILQQYYRDIRIFSIYEGTTGIQSLDLLGRKVVMNNGKAVKDLFAMMQATVSRAGETDGLKRYGDQLKEAMQHCNEVILYLTSFAAKGQYERFLADATVFMELFSTCVMGWIWLDIALTAHAALEEGSENRPAPFYESKLTTMKYYFKYEMPVISSRAKVIMHADTPTIQEDRDVLF